MGATYKLNKHCANCNVALLDTNKSGYCNKHRDRTGVNNPFWGKKHSNITIESMKERIKQASINNWKNPLYRAKVIKSVSKPRRVGFKGEQSKRVTEWYRNNPEQRTIRSGHMKRTWSEGKIAWSPRTAVNRSKMEIDLFNELKILYPGVTRKTIKVGEHWFFPDAISPRDGLIIEFYGDFWHANPDKYKTGDKIKGNTVEGIWAKDRQRVSALEALGYQVIVIWESDYKRNKASVMRRLDALLNWEGCSL